MAEKEAVSVRIHSSQLSEIEQIAMAEGKERSQVVRQLIGTGLAYQNGNSESTRSGLVSTAALSMAMALAAAFLGTVAFVTPLMSYDMVMPSITISGVFLVVSMALSLHIKYRVDRNGGSPNA